jgi:hypothetical protein
VGRLIKVVFGCEPPGNIFRNSQPRRARNVAPSSVCVKKLLNCMTLPQSALTAEPLADFVKWFSLVTSAMDEDFTSGRPAQDIVQHACLDGKPMNREEIVQTLAVLVDLQISKSEDTLAVYVPAIEDSVRLSANEIKRARKIFGPEGDPAVEMAIEREIDQWPLILTTKDVVFAPVDPEVLLESPVRMDISNAPHLVAYSEMERDAEGVALACEQLDAIDLAGLAGSFLLLRCFVAGAVRFGMRPLKTVAWWQRGWRAIGGDVPLPPFRPDSIWDKMTDDAARILLVETQRREDEDRETIVAKLTISDFAALEPTLCISQLNDEFVVAWKKWIHITPSTFARTLMKGMPAAHSEMALYPEGGGNVDVREFDDGAVCGQLQLRFSMVDKVMHIDEIRIKESDRGAGLFQRMIFNAEALAALLGLERVEVLATGIGRYALAKVGVYPQDPQLFSKTKKRS